MTKAETTAVLAELAFMAKIFNSVPYSSISGAAVDALLVRRARLASGQSEPATFSAADFKSWVSKRKNGGIRGVGLEAEAEQPAEAEPREDDEPEEPSPDIRVLGLIVADIERLKDIFRKLHATEDYHGDLRMALAAVMRLRHRVTRLIEHGEAG